MKRLPILLSVVLPLLLVAGCGGSSTAPVVGSPVVVTSLVDTATPPAGTVTLRSALAAAASGQRITFDPALDGGTILLDIVADEHTVLLGEVMGIRIEPSGPVSYLEGYFERDYGRSALYAAKDVVIDASALPAGITVTWNGEEGDDARVLAVYGDLELDNVAISGGRSVTVDISATNTEDQPWTLARGAGVAVWGRATLTDCTLYDNHCVGDFDSSRDRGAFGGGLYANVAHLMRCTLSGNTVLGGGAAGGGVFVVGGADVIDTLSTIKRSAVTGNRISSLFTYGGGVYSDGGGIGNRKTLRIENSTIARNVVEPAPGMPAFMLGMGYWRGGGIYMSNGYLELKGATVVENEVYGYARTDSLSRPNLAGGVVATVGNAHAVEEMVIGHSIVAGNLVHELGVTGLPEHTYANDVFTGSLLYFRSLGHNRFGVLDFSQILVPVGEQNWRTLCRKHYPKAGDEDGVGVDDVLDLLGGITRDAVVNSVGTDTGELAVLSYDPQGSARDVIPTAPYVIEETFAEYWVTGEATDDFLSIMLARIEDLYELSGFAAMFTAEFETYLQTVDTDEDEPGDQRHLDPDGIPILTLAQTLWFGPAITWPKELPNHAWIEFWHRLDVALLGESVPGMGPVLLGDDAWNELFDMGFLAENPDIYFLIEDTEEATVHPLGVDQQGTARPVNGLGDVGAVEAAAP